MKRSARLLLGILAVLLYLGTAAASGQTAHFSGSIVTLGSGFSYPTRVAVDGSGNIFVDDFGNNAVKEIMPQSVNFFPEPVESTSATRTLTFTFDSGTIGAPVIALGIIPAQCATAQTAPGLSSRATAHAASGSLNVAITYNGTLSGVISSSRFWMQGGSVQIEGRFYGGWSVVADIAGTHTTRMTSSKVGLGLVTATFGPRYTWSPAHKRFSLFAQGLVGEAFGFDTFFPNSAGVLTSADSLAVWPAADSTTSCPTIWRSAPSRPTTCAPSCLTPPTTRRTTSASEPGWCFTSNRKERTDGYHSGTAPFQKCGSAKVPRRMRISSPRRVY